MARFELEWIDKDADEGPLFRIGTKDIYSRERPGERVVRLKALHSPSMEYLEPAVRAFRELSEHWGAPIVYIIDPDVKKPPSASFLYEWSKAAWLNGSVDQSYMVMHNPVTHLLGRFVCRMFCQAGMPFEAILGERLLSEELDRLDLQIPWDDWSPVVSSTALARHGGFGDGPYGQLVMRLARRITGRGAAPPPR